jgi:hypothetical protein
MSNKRVAENEFQYVSEECDARLRVDIELVLWNFEKVMLCGVA